MEYDESAALRRADDRLIGSLEAEVRDLRLAVERNERFQNDRIAIVQGMVETQLADANKRLGRAQLLAWLIGPAGIAAGKLWDKFVG